LGLLGVSIGASFLFQAALLVAALRRRAAKRRG
jgi:hypothetical protein